MKINFVTVQCSEISSVSSSVSLSPASQCRYLTLDGLKHQINSKQQMYEFIQYTVNTRNTIQYNSRRMPTRSKKTRQQCALPPDPLLDLGSSLLTLTVVVALALGTSSGALKTREWTTWEWTRRHDETGVDNAGVAKHEHRSNPVTPQRSLFEHRSPE